MHNVGERQILIHHKFTPTWFKMFINFSLSQKCAFNPQRIVFQLVTYIWLRSRSDIQRTKQEFKSKEHPVLSRSELNRTCVLESPQGFD
jgi:hypothetical protein